MDLTFQGANEGKTTTLRMSKLERLNARVAKLLSVAVHEVLEVVKETVSEYQEKTARTQRENESLKRRLQELQDVFRRDNTSTAPTAVPEDQEDADQQQQQLDFSLCLKEDAEPSLTEHKPASSLELSYELRHEPRDLERAAEGDTLAECVLAQAAAEHCKVQPEEATPVTEEAPTVHTPHGAKRDARAETPSIASAASRPPPASLGFSLAAVIKTEPEVTDCTAAEPSAVQEAYGGCVDLSYNSSRQDAAEAQKTQVGNAPYGLVFVHSNHSAVSRRYGLVKANRAAFESRRTRRDHFRRDDPHVCFVCGKTFSRVGNLRIHQRCHTGEKPYGCLQCGRCFSQAGDLKKHKRVHTGEKPYYCSQCGKSFSRGENLKRHQKIHIGETLQMQQVWKEHQ